MTDPSVQATIGAELTSCLETTGFVGWNAEKGCEQEGGIFVADGAYSPLLFLRITP
jgi:hypothetical protein